MGKSCFINQLTTIETRNTRYRLQMVIKCYKWDYHSIWGYCMSLTYDWCVGPATVGMFSSKTLMGGIHDFDGPRPVISWFLTHLTIENHTLRHIYIYIYILIYIYIYYG